MKKVHKCLAVALVFLLLSGCSANTNPYEIVHEDGNYYLVISNNESEDLANEASGQIMGSVIYFASMDEMVSDINTGNFTKDEMEMISSFETDDAGRIIICDLSKLYVPILPDSVTVKKIKWTGTSYTYYLRCGDGEQFHSMKIYNSVESYNHDVDYYSNFADQTSLEVKSVSLSQAEMLPFVLSQIVWEPIVKECITQLRKATKRFIFGKHIRWKKLPNIHILLEFSDLITVYVLSFFFLPCTNAPRLNGFPNLVSGNMSKLARHNPIIPCMKRRGVQHVPDDN